MSKIGARRRPLFEVAGYFFRLSWTAFGGPLAYIAMMEDDCVEKRKWLSKDEFAEMLGITNMLPGPNATEMAIHIGYAKGGKLGAIMSGLAFTIPSFIIMVILSWLYFQYGSLPAVSGLFYGINPVVVGIIIVTAFRLGRISLVDWKLVGIFIAAVLLSYFSALNEALILLGAGIAGTILYSRALKKALLAVPVFLQLTVPSIVDFERLPIFLQLFLEFLKGGLLLFGTGLVIIPLLAPDVVDFFGWMSYKEFFDGVTLGQITPGPVMKTAAFVGYKVAGVAGAAAAMSGIFLPPFIIVTLLAPYFRRMRTNPWLRGFLKGVKAGAVGVVLAVVPSLAKIAFTDLLTIAICLLSMAAMLKTKVNLSLLVILTGILGVLLRFVRF
ncbi:chromate efflux transporter [Candidatus Bathyarchaeota archaeon]|nr:chromate efflux transporter [Candidatus Bathyarchaeota archaeon]